VIGFYGTATSSYDNGPYDVGTTSSSVLSLNGQTAVSVPVIYVYEYRRSEELVVEERVRDKAQVAREKMAFHVASLSPSWSRERPPSHRPAPPSQAPQMVHRKRCFARCGTRRERVSG